MDENVGFRVKLCELLPEAYLEICLMHFVCDLKNQTYHAFLTICFTYFDYIVLHIF